MHLSAHSSVKASAWRNLKSSCAGVWLQKLPRHLRFYRCSIVFIHEMKVWRCVVWLPPCSMKENIYIYIKSVGSFSQFSLFGGEKKCQISLKVCFSEFCECRRREVTCARKDHGIAKWIPPPLLPFMQPSLQCLQIPVQGGIEGFRDVIGSGVNRTDEAASVLQSLPEIFSMSRASSPDVCGYQHPVLIFSQGLFSLLLLVSLQFCSCAPNLWSAWNN